MNFARAVDGEEDEHAEMRRRRLVDRYAPSKRCGPLFAAIKQQQQQKSSRNDDDDEDALFVEFEGELSRHERCQIRVRVLPERKHITNGDSTPMEEDASVILRRLLGYWALGCAFFVIFFVLFWVCWAPFVGPGTHGFPVVGPLYATGVYDTTTDGGYFYFRCLAQVARRDGGPPRCFVPCDRWIGGGDPEPALRYAEESFAPPGKAFVLLHDTRRCFIVRERGAPENDNELVTRWMFGVMLLGISSVSFCACAICLPASMHIVVRRENYARKRNRRDAAEGKADSDSEFEFEC